MTKKDHITVADIVIKQYKDINAIYDDLMISDVVYPAIQQLTMTYPNFDPIRFEVYVRDELTKWKIDLF